MFPECVRGCRVLDLGSGAGIDCFVLSKLVGPDGQVIGVDMTAEQVGTLIWYRSIYTSLELQLKIATLGEINEDSMCCYSQCWLYSIVMMFKA